MSKLRKWLNGTEVMKRLDISILDLYELAKDGRLQGYCPQQGEKVKEDDFPSFFSNDSFGNTINKNSWPEIIIVRTKPDITTDDLEQYYFLISDVEVIEKGQMNNKPPNKNKWGMVRRKAADLWQRDPTITITDMALRDEITSILGRNYAVKTIREHIKDLCPNRTPGRRSGKQ